MKLVAAQKRYDRWKMMRSELYGELSDDFQEAEMKAISKDKEFRESFIEVVDDVEVGMLEMSLRNFVDGCLSSPVAYIEGIYINSKLRGQGYGAKIIDLAKNWAKSKQCIELASDTEINNTNAQKFHDAVGFKETYRIVQYKMTLD
ncbi:GNAT family N-acetyltransferase [Fulvivirga sp. RKSG066]|nr:GNAT family N-acetyltransferase [Fulvivirga aurantia]